MEKIKSILSPGKDVDDEVLYGSGHGSSPTSHRSLKDAGISSPQDASRSSEAERYTAGTNEQSSEPLVRAEDYASSSQQPSVLTSLTHPNNAESSTVKPIDSHGGQHADQLFAPEHYGAGTDQPSSRTPVATQDYASSTQQPPTLTSSTAFDTADRSATAYASSHPDQRADQVWISDRNLRPEYPTPTSARSTASIKSNVIGRAPTGSSFVQEQGNLPPVPATDGKFINDEALMVDIPTPVAGLTSDQAFPLAGGAGAVAANIGSTSSPHQTVIANRLDPNLGSASYTPAANSQAVDSDNSRTHHYGRDANFVGVSAGAAGLAAHEAVKRHKPTQNEATVPTSSAREANSSSIAGVGAYQATKPYEPTQNEPIATTNSSREPTSYGAALDPITETSTPSKLPTSSIDQGTGSSRDDYNLRHMPGAYPETPANESDKTLGSNSAAPAVVAAQAAYKKHTQEPMSKTRDSVIAAEASPYTSTLDPRVESATKQAATRSATGGALSSTSTGPTSNDPTSSTPASIAPISNAPTSTESTSTAPLNAISPKQTAEPQGSFGEKIQETQAKEYHHDRDFALAGAAAATIGVSAYEVSKGREHGLTSTAQLPAPTQQPTAVGTGQPQTMAGKAIATAEPVKGSPITADSKDREFPLGTSHEQSQTSKTINFSHPTGVQERAPVTHEARPIEHRTFPADAAETGAAGAGGAGAYEALKHQEDASHVPYHFGHDDPLESSARPRALESYDDQRAAPTHSAHAVGREPQPDRYRDAAITASSTAVSSTAAAGLAGEKPLDSKLERERERTAEHKHEEYGKHERQLPKSEEKHPKSEEKHRKSEDKEHKHGLLHRILHPHKSKDGLDKEKEDRTSPEPSRYSYEKPSLDSPSYAMQGDEHSATGTDGETPEHLKQGHDRNRLHKDPPTGYNGK